MSAEGALSEYKHLRLRFGRALSWDVLGLGLGDVYNSDSNGDVDGGCDSNGDVDGSCGGNGDICNDLVITITRASTSNPSQCSYNHWDM